MKTKTDYEPDRKKGKGRISKIAEFTVSITDSMSERFKVSGSGGGQVRRCWTSGGILSYGDAPGNGRARIRHRRSGLVPATPDHLVLKISSFSEMITYYLILITGKTRP